MASVVQWKVKAHDVGGPNSTDFFWFWGLNNKQRSFDGRGARSALIGVAMSPKRRVRAAHGRARAAKNPLVINNNLALFSVRYKFTIKIKTFADTCIVNLPQYLD
jgi:hypothetical protein